MTDDLDLRLKITAETAGAQASLKSVQQSVKDVGKAATEAGADGRSGLQQVEQAAGEIAPEARQAAEAIQDIADEAVSAGRSGAALGQAEHAAEGVARAALDAAQASEALGEQAARGGQRAASGYSRAREGVESISHQLDRAQKAAGAFFGLQQAEKLVALADSYKNLQARVNLAAGGAEAGAAAFEQLFQIANRTQQPVEAVGQLYARVGGQLRELGVSQQDTLGFTETLAQAFRVSGASAQEAENSIIQLAQGMAAGALRGEELNSVLEQGPRVAQALADGLGVPRGELRKLAEEGKLTSEAVVNALLSQRDVLQAEYAQLPRTVGGALTELRNNFTQYIGEVDASAGITDKAAQAVGLLAGNLDELGSLLTVVGEIAAAQLAVKAAGAAQAFAGQVLTATQGVKGLRGAMAALPTSLKIAIAVIGYELLDEVGTRIGEYAAKLAGADDAARAAGEARRAQLASEIAALIEAGAASGHYLSTQSRTAEQIAALGDAARARYAVELDGAEQALLANYSLELRERELAASRGFSTQQYDEQLSRISARLREVRAEQDQIATLDATAAAAALAGMSVAAKQLADGFALVKGDARASAEAIQKLAQQIDLTSFDGIRDGVDALRLLGEQGKLSGEQIEQLLSARLRELSTGELANFELSATAAFDGVTGKTDELGLALETLRTERLRRLGIDAQEVLTGIDAKARELLETFRGLVNDPQADPRIIDAAWQSLLRTLDTPQELAALRQIATDAGLGTVALQALEAKLLDLGRAADPAAQQLEQAFAAFGIQTRQQLEEAAAQAKKSFDLISGSGQATAQGLTQAFQRMADAQLKAAAAQGKAALSAAAVALKASAATDTQRAALERLIAEYGAAGDAGRHAGAQQVGAAQSATQAIDEQRAALARLGTAYTGAAEAADELRRRDRIAAGQEAERNKYAGSGLSGGSASVSQIDPRLSALNAQDQQAVIALWTRLVNQNIDAFNSSGSASRQIPDSEIQRMVRSLITTLASGGTGAEEARARALGLYPDPLASPRTGTTGVPANPTVNINLSLLGQTISLQGSPDQVALLQQLLQQLQQQAAVSGG